MTGRGRTLGRALGALALAAALIALAPGTALARWTAASGDNGRVVTQTELGGQSWLDARVQVEEGPDGTIIAAVGNSVFRYLPDGTLDPSFGDGGRLAVAAELRGMPFTPHDLAVDTEGRIYLLGEVQVTSVEVPISYIGGFFHPPLAAVVRYTADGKLDTTYGNGKGYVATDFGLGGRISTEAPDVQYEKALTSFASGAVDPNGDLIAVAAVGEFPCSQGHSSLSMRRKLIVRLTPNGSLDASLGEGDGMQTISALDENGPPAIGAGEEIGFAGSRSDACTETSAYGVAHLRADGTVDSRFGDQGVRTLPAPAGAIAFDRFGRTIVLLPGWQLLRLTPRGGGDRRFGRRGSVRLRLPTGTDLQSLAVERAGRILLAGTVLGRAHPSLPGSPRNARGFAIVRLTAHGHKDRRFGRRGWVATRFGKRSSAVGQDGFVDAEGRLVVAGPIARPNLAPTGGIALVRYRLGR